MIYVTSERQGDRAAGALFSAGEDAVDVAAAAARRRRGGMADGSGSTPLGALTDALQVIWLTISSSALPSATCTQSQRVSTAYISYDL